MVKLKGPMLSLEASGTLAETVTVSNWKGRAYMKKHAVPSNNQQQAQLGIRTAMTFLTQQWSGLSAAQQESWQDLAEADQVSPVNSYVGTNLLRVADALAPTKEYPAAETAWAPAWGGVVTEVFPTFVRVQLTVLPGPVPWPFFLYRDASTGFTPSPSNLVAMALGVNFPSVINIRDEPPSHGTWYYRKASGSPDGSIAIDATETTVVF